MKLMGAILIVLAAGWVGFRTAYGVRQELRQLRQLHGALELMQCEISCRLTPVPELCRLIGRSTGGDLASFFDAAARRLELQEEISTRAAFDSVLHGFSDRFSPELTWILQQLGDVLGAFDAPEQAKALQTLLEQTELAATQLQQGRAARCRSYQVMGVCAGCALVIILL